jgi:hypothetical protein
MVASILGRLRSRLGFEGSSGHLRARIGRDVISLFILFHLVAFAAWTVPVNAPLLDKFKNLIRPYMLWSGLFQAWNMFAPDPLRVNSYLEAEITLTNGEVLVWREPRMEKLNPVAQYFKERYRKYMNEHLRLGAETQLLPDAARHLARMYNTDQANPPVRVRLIRFWSDVLPPGPRGEYNSSPWTHYSFFTYDVKTADLAAEDVTEDVK